MTWAQTMVMASHWVGLTLPGMIDEPGSFSGSLQLAEPAARPRAEQTDVVGDLGQADRQHVESAGQLDRGVLGRERLELVLRA